MDVNQDQSTSSHEKVIEVKFSRRVEGDYCVAYLNDFTFSEVNRQLVKKCLRPLGTENASAAFFLKKNTAL